MIQEVIKFMMVAVVSILQVVVVSGAKGCQSCTKALEGSGKGDLVQFIGQAANDIYVFTLLSKRGGGSKGSTKEAGVILS